MNLTDNKFKNFALVQEMLQTPEIMRNFKWDQGSEAAAMIQEKKRLFLTGEGSSRIFPAKNIMNIAMKAGVDLTICTDGCRQAHCYDLSKFVVFGASNSGQTKELISLFTKLKQGGHKALFGLTANSGTKLAEIANVCYVLSCGKEDAVAATKSVVEQAAFYHAIVAGLAGCTAARDNQQAGADAAKTVLEANLDPEMVKAIAGAKTIYFAGRNDGVAEELTLKTNEITRKKSAFLEGTYAVHGIEEVMDKDDVVIVVNPFEAEVDKFKEVLVGGVGMKVFAIAPQKTIFPTIEIPSVKGYDTYLQLLAGWNVLVHVGVFNQINLDKPVRARKVGNEFVG